MSMLKVHAAALGSEIPCVHEFKLRYSKTSKVVYGFVEGKDDPSFYHGLIDNALPEDWEVELWPAGSKKNVYKIRDGFDWRRFKKRRICFFVDRDLSELIPEKYPVAPNIYSTPCYSIENIVASRGVCRRVLTEALGFATAPKKEIDNVCDHFERELENFYVQLVPVMAWILNWRRSKQPASLSNIQMNHVIRIDKGSVLAISNPKGKASLVSAS